MITTPEQVYEKSFYGTLPQWREAYEACERAEILDYWEWAVTEVRPKLGLGPVEVQRWAEGMWSINHQPSPEDLDRELQAAIDENQRAFDEEMAARHRQRDTPTLRRIEGLLGLRRRRQR